MGQDTQLALLFLSAGLPGTQHYAQHALECRRQGYTHYKIHPYYFWDPLTQQADPGRPSHIAQDIEVCQAVRAATLEDPEGWLYELR